MSEVLPDFAWPGFLKRGEVAEWLKAAVCKDRYTVKSRIGGSNPSPLRHTQFGRHARLKRRQPGENTPKFVRVAYP